MWREFQPGRVDKPVGDAPDESYITVIQSSQLNSAPMPELRTMGYSYSIENGMYVPTMPDPAPDIYGEWYNFLAPGEGQRVQATRHMGNYYAYITRQDFVLNLNGIAKVIHDTAIGRYRVKRTGIMPNELIQPRPGESLLIDLVRSDRM